MKASLSSFTTVAAMVLGACAHEPLQAPFNVLVRGPASECSIEVQGKKLDLDELLVLARSEARPGRRARIDSDMDQTPYRCIGGAIYTLQLAGFKQVGFVSEPAASKR